MKILQILVILSFLTTFVNAQSTDRLSQTSEKVIKYNFEKATQLIGIYYGTNVFAQLDYGSPIQLYSLNESNFSFNRIFEYVSLKFPQSNTISIKDSLLLYCNSFFSPNDGYSQLVLNFKGKLFELDSIYNVDKGIHAKFSNDNHYLIINTLNTLSDYYNPNQDNQFIVYDLQDIKNGNISRKTIPCMYCADGYLIKDTLFFTKSNERDDFDEGYAWTDIYMAPFNNIEDTTRIASSARIQTITPDGKYILATRQKELANSPSAIINVENKKYQLLLGRNYYTGASFYSYQEKKFVFRMNSHIIYVDFPKEYPFNALLENNPDVQFQDWRKIYEQFKLPPLE